MYIKTYGIGDFAQSIKFRMNKKEFIPWGGSEISILCSRYVDIKDYS